MGYLSKDEAAWVNKYRDVVKRLKDWRFFAQHTEREKRQHREDLDYIKAMKKAASSMR